jgi:ABC-type transport system substrate-binding protein
VLCRLLGSVEVVQIDIWGHLRGGKRMKRCRLGSALIVTMVGLLLLAPRQILAQQPQPGGTLRVAWEADLSGIDPHVSSGLQAYRVVGNIFNSLVSIDAALNYVPELAESWEILENSQVYVFHLRKGVKFHDGTDFDAEVVRWNYQRITDPEEKALDAPFYSIVEAVEAIDAYTVKFTLKHPSRTLLPVIAAYRVGFAQMSPAAYKQWGKQDVRLHPVGTGPFKLARWEPNLIIVLEKNPHYFKLGLPYLDRVDLRIMKEGVTRVAALRTGEVDFANYIPAEHVERLTKDPQLQIIHSPDGQRIQCYFNLRKPAFQDVRVRQALLGYGIDRQAIVKTALLGHAQPLWSFVAPGSRGHIDFGDQFPYNPEKAKALLKEAGYDEKNPLHYTLMTHGAEAALPNTATIMKTQYAKLGVDVTVEIIDRPIFLQRLTRTRDWDQLINFSGAAFDTYALARLIDTRAGNNSSNHQDTHVNALIDRLREAPTDGSYLQAGYDLQRYVTENMLYQSLTTLPFTQAAQAYVKGYGHLRAPNRFEATWLDR